MVARDDDDGGGITLEPGFSYDNKPNHLITFKRNVIPYPVRCLGLLADNMSIVIYWSTSHAGYRIY